MYIDSSSGAYLHDQAMLWGPRILLALLILIVTWIAARAVKWALHRTVDTIPALQRHHHGAPGETVGHQLGTIARLIVWLVGIMAALQFLGIGQILAPINALTLQIFGFLPKLLGAGLIFFVGLIVARIVRKIVETALTVANVDGLLARAGIGDNASTVRADPVAVPPGTVPGATRATLARATGILVFAAIIIPVSIAALQVLAIDAISVPAINMLNEIFSAIPRLLTAALWLGVAFIAGRFLKTIIEGVLPPTGFDQAIRSTGILPGATMPSKIVANIAFVAVILTAAIEAAQQLGGSTIAIFLAQITELGGKVIFGTLIIVAGVFLARIVAGLVGSSTGDGGYAQMIVRYSIIALFTAIGLTFMGLADMIVMMAFGLILGSAAVAAALAFGLGGREAAGRFLERYTHGAPPPAGTTPATARQASVVRRRPAALGVTARFAAFVGIDWSGAKGRRHKGIAVARAPADARAPVLIRPGHVWSRTEVLEWLTDQAARTPTLFGFDFSFAPPFIERGTYLPGEKGVPGDARSFWSYVDARAPDDDLGAASFLERVHRRHFYFGIADGKKADFVRFRRCDEALNAQGGRKTASAYDAIGAAQVAKASFSGMRLLHRLDRRVPVWPIDPLPEDGSVVVEIYTRIFLRRAGLPGNKLRTAAALDTALIGLGGAPAQLPFDPDDHQADAIVTAAGMRALAACPGAFTPAALTAEIARTEGWTFGVL